MISQVRRFIGVGLLATVAHVAVALLVERTLDVSPKLANLAGFFAGVGISYLGHAWVTFGNPAGHFIQFSRFISLSLVGLALSSGITVLVCSVLGSPFLTAQLVVAMTVPVITFLVSRSWVFAVPSLEAQRPSAFKAAAARYGRG